MRPTIRIAAVFLLYVSGQAHPRNPEVRRPEHRHGRWTAYRHHVFGRYSWRGPAASAVIGQLRHAPHEWGGGAGGFGARFASGFGTHIVKGTIEFGVAAWRHENLHYQRSHLHGTWPRMKYAMKSTFWVPRTNRPRRHTLATSRISGAIGAGLISRLWQPASAAGLGTGFASGGISLGADVGLNMAREFWPHRRHRAEARKTRQRFKVASARE